MHIDKTNSDLNKRSPNTVLTTLACILAGVFPTYSNAASLEGCYTSVYSQDDANGCAVSAGAGQKVDGSVFGGSSNNGAANNNRVNIANGADISDSVYGGFAKKDSNHNEVVVSNDVKIGTGKDGGGVRGGSSLNFGASFNAVRIGNNTTVNGSVVGGSGDIQAIRDNIEIDTSSNSVHIGDNSFVTGSVTGGSGGKTSSFNEVYIGNNVQVGREVSLGSSGGIIEGGGTAVQADFVSTEANSNIVHIGDDVSAGQIRGGSAIAPFSSENTVSENRITIGDRINTLFAVAGEGWKDSTVTKNTLIVGNDAKMAEAYGGRSASGNISENMVQIGRNLTANYVYGGDAYSAVAGKGGAHNNTVIIGENATVNARVVGGNGGLGSATNNRVVIYKGFNIGSIVGGLGTENTGNNTVTLFGGTVTGAIFGGVGSNNTGNTLNLGSSNEAVEMNSLSAEEVGKFDTYNFYLPENVRHNDTALKLSKLYVDLGNATVNAYVPGNADLKAGDVVHLIQIQNDSGGLLAWSGQGKVYQGVTLSHDLAGIALDGQERSLDLTLQRNNIQSNTDTAAENGGGSGSAADTGEAAIAGTTAGTGVAANADVAAVAANLEATTANTGGSASVASVNPQTKSLLQGRLVAPALINGGADYLTGGLDSLYQNVNLSKDNIGSSSNGFTHIRGDNRDVTTGSHVRLKGVALDAGFAWKKTLGLGNLIYGVAAEYGYTRYTAHLDDGTRGKGKAWYLGANTFGNYLWKSGLYVQGSLRAGRVAGDYLSNDFTHANGNNVSYDSDSNYLAGHLGVGKIWQLRNQNTLDTYIKYFDSRTSSDTVTLSSGEIYNFASVRSQRGRIGVQYNHNLGNNRKIHAGIAYEREWDGNVRAHYQSYSLPSPTMKGGTTVGEAGMDYQLGSKQLNTALQAYGGRQRGMGIRLGMKF